MQYAWTSLQPASEEAHDHILRLARAVAAALPSRFDIEQNPHVSILPKFGVPEPAMDDVLESQRAADAPHTITVSSFSTFHPLDSDDPTFAVMLDVETDLTALREYQSGVVREADGELCYADDPTDLPPPHMTLAKSGDGDDDNEPLTVAERRRLADAIEPPSGGDGRKPFNLPVKLVAERVD